MILLRRIVNLSQQQLTTTTWTNRLNLYRSISSQQPNDAKTSKTPLRLFGVDYERDDWTNLSGNIIEKLDRKLLLTRYHPLNHLMNMIKYYFYKNFTQSGSPLFSAYDNFSPVVTVEQNFDSLLTPANHVSRSKKDCFYVNKSHLLRAHTTCHDAELIRAGLNAFLTFGDVYRRDEIDAKHYPVFHQCDGVRLFNRYDLANTYSSSAINRSSSSTSDIEIFSKKNDDVSSAERQGVYTLDASKIVESELKNCLTGLAEFVFGGSGKIDMKWVETTFPFTHPSWELEVQYKGVWYEILGCGILKHDILKNAGAQDYIGWAFGLGLERWAMILYDMPDIRLFWSRDNGVLNQFKYDDPTYTKVVKYKPVSVYPQCKNDISFWLPENHASTFSSNDFYDLVREVAGDMVEQVELVDSFENKKKQRTSHCYRIVYRSMERTLTQAECNDMHKKIEACAIERLGVEIR